MLRLPHGGIALNEAFGGEGAISIITRARSDARASWASASDHRTAPADRRTG